MINDINTYDNRWLEFIDSYPEDTSVLEVVAACINKFGDCGVGLTFSNWGTIVRNYLNKRTINSTIGKIDVTINEPKKENRTNCLVDGNSHGLQNSVYLNDLVGSIFSMKCCQKDGYKAPHKAIYLLSILDCIESGYIRKNRFQINFLLLNKFESNWRKYAVHFKCFTPNIWNTIFYMENSIIHKVYNTGYEGAKPNSLKRCEVVFKYLEIPYCLWEFLQDDKKLNSLRNDIIRTYL